MGQAQQDVEDLPPADIDLAAVVDVRSVHLVTEWSEAQADGQRGRQVRLTRGVVTCAWR